MSDVRSAFSLAGRSVLVAGAGDPIGTAVARAMAFAGARLALADADEARLGPLVESLAGHESCLTLRADVSDGAQAEAAVDRVMFELGRLDVLFCLAGRRQRPDGIYELETPEWRRVLAANLDSAFFGAREAAKVMVEQGGGGKIVLVAALPFGRGNRAYPAAAQAAATAGVAGLIRQLALELGRFSITVNGLAPGGFRSPPSIPESQRDARLEEDLRAAVPLGRLARPDEIQGAALFLASRASDFVTGQVLAVDGGLCL
ncbi:MAG: SDR family NAD(P)-dependent oxidoreductase [Chloroflexota bacterium]